MEELIKYLETVIDLRQAKKVKHKMSDIIAIVFFATLANAENWSEIWLFADMYQEYLKKYLELANGIPSHDTIERVFAMVSSEFLQKLHVMWKDKHPYGMFISIQQICNIFLYLDAFHRLQRIVRLFQFFQLSCRANHGQHR